MKKITIKHYLNTTVKPVRIRGKYTAYPLYLQIVTNRTNQKMKSFFETYITESDYEKMINNEPYGEETEIGNPEMRGRKVDEEPILLDKAIRYLWDNNVRFTTRTSCFKKYIEEFLRPAVYVFKKAAGSIEAGDDKSGVLISCFNIYGMYSRRTLIQISKTVKDITQIDVLDYIDEYTIKIWQVVELVKVTASNNTYEGMTFFEFMENNPIERLTGALTDPKIRDFCQISDKRNLQKPEIIQILRDLERRIRVRANTIFN